MADFDSLKTSIVSTYDPTKRSNAGLVALSVSWNGLDALRQEIAEAGLRAPYAIAKALDEVGRKVQTFVVREMASQAGVPYGRARSIVHAKQAMGAGNGEFQIIARDVAMSLKEFAPIRTSLGVSAAPWGKRQTFPRPGKGGPKSFIGPGGHVYVREGNARLPIKKLWGPVLPDEMVKQRSEVIFYKVTNDLLPFTLEKWLLGRKA